MNENQIKKFKEMCRQFVEQDNYSTRDPIYLVQTRCYEYTDEDHNPDGFWIIDSKYGQEIGTFEFKNTISEILNEIDAYTNIIMNDYEDIININDLIEKLNDNGNNFEISYYKYEYHTKFYSLFEKDAQDYMIYQSHNLDHPRIYVDYIGYGSKGLMNELYKLMTEIGGEK